MFAEKLIKKLGIKVQVEDDLSYENRYGKLLDDYHFLHIMMKVTRDNFPGRFTTDLFKQHLERYNDVVSNRIGRKRFLNLGFVKFPIPGDIK